MRPSLFPIIACLALGLQAGEPAVHHFDANGDHLVPGRPDPSPKLLAIAGKPIRLEWAEPGVDKVPRVSVRRLTAARAVPLNAGSAEATGEGWRWTWTPPEARGPARYEVRFESEARHTVRIETRDPDWVGTTLDMLRDQVDWQPRGLGDAERAALVDHRLKIDRGSPSRPNEEASLEMIPREGGSGRRRVVWSDDEPALVVWRPGPAAGDLEIRAPRWWISPQALATDHGLIRFLDLFSEPPRNP